MKEPLFSNEVILSWLQYYAQNTAIDLEHVKMIDITKKNKNVIPTVEAHKTTLVFTNAGVDDIFYRLWNAGLGECDDRGGRTSTFSVRDDGGLAALKNCHGGVGGAKVDAKDLAHDVVLSFCACGRTEPLLARF